MEENFSRVSSAGSEDSSETKKRRKRKWDQPAEILVSAGVAVPGILPMRSLNSATLPKSVSSSEAALASTIGVSSKASPSLFQVPFAAPKINQPKIQDELIAREIVINDADSAVRYKLTKRQTQEEIQRCSGAVVITRGRYHPSNVTADNEKPLYLHISAGAHLETTMERIKAVDMAAAMVEEMLKQTSITNFAKVVHPFSISVFLGFEADPSLSIAARIRGPNDQYVNHIMNDTGATVVLRGHGSGNSGTSFDEERQPLHLFLSSSNPQSLERAKLLAENLLDTISREFGASRISSNVYGAVPPPQQLTSAQSSGNGVTLYTSLATSTLTPVVSVTMSPVSSPLHIGAGLSSVPSQPKVGCYPQPSLTSGTSYYGYGGIYPQATPLQQVALALKQSPSLINSTAPQATIATNVTSNSNETLSSKKEKRRRKFQELPAAASNGCAKSDQNLLQGATLLKPSEPKPDSLAGNLSTVLAPKKLSRSAVNEMPPPPPRTMPPPPPPKFYSPPPAPKVSENNALDKSKQDNIPDTLIKLMEYGEEDDEDGDDTTEDPRKGDSNGLATSKPFWAV